MSDDDFWKQRAKEKGRQPEPAERKGTYAMNREQETNERIADVAGHFFEGPVKRFLEEWDDEIGTAPPGALYKLANAVRKASAKYWNATTRE